MRNPSKLLAILMLLPAVSWGQEVAPAASGHFEGWPESLQWGDNKRTFEVLSLSLLSPKLSLFSVAEKGFGWRAPFTDESIGVFKVWAELAGWCRSPDALWVRLDTGQLWGIELMSTEDRLVIVDEYFSRFAPEQEINRPDQACNGATIQLPEPDNRAQIVEMLESAERERQ